MYHGKPNTYWSNIINRKLPIYFITKGPDKSEVVHPSKCNGVEYEEDEREIEENGEKKLQTIKTKIKLPGFEKPVCGLYSPFYEITKETYDKTRYHIGDENYKKRYW